MLNETRSSRLSIIKHWHMLNINKTKQQTGHTVKGWYMCGCNRLTSKYAIQVIHIGHYSLTNK